MNLSLCITTYNRYELLKESYAQVIDDPRISEIIIVDDCSTEPGTKEKVNSLAGGKVKVFHQVENRGMSRNKADAISYASNPWVLIFDSDNIIGPDYLDAFYKMLNGGQPLEDIIYCPDFSRPTFDYSSLSGKLFTPKMVKHQIGEDNFLNMAMNTCNYIVNRDLYLKTYKYNPDHIASDTVWFNYNWMQGGGFFYFVPGMQYFHRTHKGSGFLQGVDHNMRMQAQVRKMIMEL